MSPSANLFTRDGLIVTASPLPIWDILMPILLGLILLDVAVRRIAWDWAGDQAPGDRRWSGKVREFTLTTRKIESAPTLDALKQRARGRGRAASSSRRKRAARSHRRRRRCGPIPRPSSSRRTERVEGDITNVVGGATDKPIPAAPKKIEPAGGGGHTGSLLEAKRRAQQQIKKKEQGGYVNESNDETRMTNRMTN